MWDDEAPSSSPPISTGDGAELASGTTSTIVITSISTGDEPSSLALAFPSGRHYFDPLSF
jgi:hypothetical protein